MDLTIEKTVENPYLQRKEVHGTVTFTGATPAQKQIAEALSAKLNTKPEAIFVEHVYTSFGAQKATFEAHVYPSKEQLEKVVRLGKKARDKAAGKAPAAAEAKPAEAAKPAAEAAKPAAKKEEPAKAAEKKEEPKKEAPKKEEKQAEKAAEPKKQDVKPADAKKEEPKKAEAKAEAPKKAEAKA